MISGTPYEARRAKRNSNGKKMILMVRYLYIETNRARFQMMRSKAEPIVWAQEENN